jgi:hypothetical protein
MILDNKIADYLRELQYTKRPVPQAPTSAQPPMYTSRPQPPLPPTTYKQARSDYQNMVEPKPEAKPKEMGVTKPPTRTPKAIEVTKPIRTVKTDCTIIERKNAGR